MRHKQYTMNRLQFLALAMVSMFPNVVMAQDKSPGKPQRKAAVTPEVQTAEWAKSWWMPRHEAKLKEKESMAKVDMLWIGDSITHGWEGKGKTVWEKYYAPRNALNIGFSGDRTEQVLWRLENGEIDGLHPKVVVIMIGTNNTGHRQDPAIETAEGVQAVLTKLKEKTPESKILLLGIFPRGATKEDPLRKLNDEINTILKTYGDNERVFFLDIGSKFLDDQGQLPTSIMADLLHPDEDGYRIWAEAIEESVVKLMK